jgi:hypothetical protein
MKEHRNAVLGTGLCIPNHLATVRGAAGGGATVVIVIVSVRKWRGGIVAR